MSEIKVGVVMTCAAGREENAEEALDWLFNGDETPEAVAIVLDGDDVEAVNVPPTRTPVLQRNIAKHKPGDEQPRNIGARGLVEVAGCTHVWFLDSDIIVSPQALAAYKQAAREAGDDCVLIGPYEWLAPGLREPLPGLYNDPRWEMFRERGLGPFVAELGVALGCFGGNLVWPLEQFVKVGGFHPMLHHGRCEDGELGLRAASHQIPMALVAEARGWHMAHEVNYALAEARNKRDVPLLNSWHPWVEQQGLVVTDQDGARFDFRCTCGQQVNTLEMWDHLAGHQRAGTTAPDLILPDELS